MTNKTKYVLGRGVPSRGGNKLSIAIACAVRAYIFVSWIPIVME
ncbi:hypothetical protein [Aerosakkonema funiforme]|nr:hypothetical protein [Aerosakkonema funiforme]